MQQDDDSSFDCTRKSCLYSPWNRWNCLWYSIIKIPWKFSYSVTYSFPTNKRQEKGEQEKWQNQSLEFQRRRVEVGICLTVSPKQWYLCIDEIQNLAERGPESHALTEPLIAVEWRETPDRVYGTLEILWYNIFIIPSFLN